MKELSPFNKLSYHDLDLIKYVLDDYTQYGSSKNYEGSTFCGIWIYE